MAQAERLLVQGSERGAGASLQSNVIEAVREADPHAQARTRALQTHAQGPMTAHVEAAREALGAKYALRANEYSSQARHPRQAKANASYYGGIRRDGCAPATEANKQEYATDSKAEERELGPWDGHLRVEHATERTKDQARGYATGEVALGAARRAEGSGQCRAAESAMPREAERSDKRVVGERQHEWGEHGNGTGLAVFLNESSLRMHAIAERYASSAASESPLGWRISQTQSLSPCRSSRAGHVLLSRKRTRRPPASPSAYEHSHK